jgi:hypothetical protein
LKDKAAAAAIVPLWWGLNVTIAYSTTSFKNSSQVAHELTELTKKHLRNCRNNTWVASFFIAFSHKSEYTSSFEVQTLIL